MVFVVSKKSKKNMLGKTVRKKCTFLKNGLKKRARKKHRLLKNKPL